MIKFFRKIRQNLVAEGKTAKYLKYAIGEVLLVMIGIILALQVNNWNETRKERSLELEYLEGIKTDLENDLPAVENRVMQLLRRISVLHKIDPTYIPNERIKTHDVPLDSIRLVDNKRLTWVFNRGALTRLTTGSYTALTTNASAGLVKNTDLLKSIQYLYEIRYPGNLSIYEDIKRREEYVSMKYAKELKNSNIKEFFIENPNKEEVLADFNFYYRQQDLMYRHSLNNLDLIAKLIEDINAELERR